MTLTSQDRAQVAEAIRAAEATTDGEIAVIAAARSDNYNDAVLHWALLAAILALAVIAWRPGILVAIRALPDGGWSGAYPLGQLLFVLLLILCVAFLVVRWVIGLAPIRMALTPGGTKTRRVRRRAIELFKAGTERRTATRTGVLLYLSLAERRAEIVVDQAIHKAVPQERWGEAMAALLEEMRAGRPGHGIVAAVGRIGAVLAGVMPHTGADPNELPDRLIEL